MRIFELFKVTFVILLLLAYCQNPEVKNNFQKEYKQIQKKFDLEFCHDESYLILIPLTGCSSCLQPVLDFVNNNRTISNLTCIFSDIGTKRMESILKDTNVVGIRVIYDDDASVYQYEPYLNSPVIYHVHNNYPIERIMLNSDNAQMILSKIKTNAYY